MGFLEVITIIFVVCKVSGFIDWSWWLVFLPELIAIAVYVIWFTWFGSVFTKMMKK